MNNNACGTEINHKNFDSPVSTLIFMDLETTGLPGEIGKRNVHITELSLIAIDRNDFETDNTLRVLNKLSLCIRPRACVSPSAMYITGLYNDVLQNQEEFDDSVPKMLEFFFRRLRTPICLLAHNGNKFDFPVLQAELKRLNYTLHSKVLCADTLEAFRTICRTPQTVKTASKQPMSNFKNELEKTNGKTIDSRHQKEMSKLIEHNHLFHVSENNATTNNQNENELDNEIDSLLEDDIESFRDIEESTELNERQPFENTVVENLQPQSKNGNNFVSVFDDEHTPKRAKINNLVENGKLKKQKSSKDIYSIKSEYENRNLPDTSSVAAKRKLFTETTGRKNANQSASEMKLNSIASFTLEKLYHHFFGEAPPQSHYAEADCIALSKVCQKIKEQFLNWLDENSSEFSEIQPLW
ncbi:three-prime repair exonuclease 1-like [Uloborus diversus]|uniref:three-prime repair exonuclease 1-like n=1 Tax=Uloborus diversus TaxID=327109 RepID=UPI002409E515|nr:three-prime repair exonuclease 1-like [Uloborus diversus]